MKNDRGVKSDIGNVEMTCLFFSPFFASLSSDSIEVSVQVVKTRKGGGGGAEGAVCLGWWFQLKASRVGNLRDIVCPWGVFIYPNFHPLFLHFLWQYARDFSDAT